MTARYFDVQDIQWIEGERSGVADYPLYGLKYHRHWSMKMRKVPGALVYTCDECDAFAWMARP